MARISPTLIGKSGWGRCTCGQPYELGTTRTPGICDRCTDQAYRNAERALQVPVDLRTAKP